MILLINVFCLRVCQKTFISASIVAVAAATIVIPLLENNYSTSVKRPFYDGY